ncbi:3082_t:CDS:1, partial [Acaulospora morrowiae]
MVLLRSSRGDTAFRTLHNIRPGVKVSITGLGKAERAWIWGNYSK